MPNQIQQASGEGMEKESLPPFVGISIGLQCLAAFIVLATWAAWTTWGVFPFSLLFSGVVFFPTLLLFVASLIGLLKGKMFGWVIGILGNAFFAIILFMTARLFSLLPITVLAYLLLPGVRNYYLRNYYE